MQGELRVALLLIGVLFIAGLLVKGFWSTRKQQQRHQPNRFETKKEFEPNFGSDRVDDDVDEEYDDLMVSSAKIVQPAHEYANEPSIPPFSAVREDDAGQAVSEDVLQIRSHQPETESQAESEPAIETNAETHQSETDELDIKNTLNKAAIDPNAAPVYSGVVTQPKPEFVKPSKVTDESETESLNPPSFLLKKNEAESDAVQYSHQQNAPDADERQDANKFSEKPVQKEAEKNQADAFEAKKELSFTEQAKRLVKRKPKSLAEKIRREPSLSKNKKNDDQMRIDFGDSPIDDSAESTEQSHSQDDKDQKPLEQDVLILNVQTSAENPIAGAALLPMLLTLGFKFGEHDIFHRHVNTNGKGPILFSLTNLFKPGTFDIDNMENFSTQGLSLFMMLPIEGEAQQVFNMMHNAARKIAEEFTGKILDANRVPISKQSLQQYNERIRDFERKRLMR